MGKSRPINTRPWRRPPWRKSARPKRWISLNSGATNGNPGYITTPWSVSPAENAGLPPNVVLAAGQQDVEPWADNQEVLVDRVVGDINIGGFFTAEFADIPPANYAPHVVVRFGMMVQEEADATTAPFINLFADEALEDFEWMWLHETTPENLGYATRTSSNAIAGMGFYNHIHLDLRVKRKLGQTDLMLLYAQYALFDDPSIVSSEGSISASHVLRSIFMSK